MKKKILLRCLLCASISLTISTLITLFISVLKGDGKYYFVAPALISDYGSELNAMLVQSAASLLLGASWGGASLIWEFERMSLLKQTISHFIICSVVNLLTAYFLHWLPSSFTGAALYFGVFSAIYILFWIISYWKIKRYIMKINSKLQIDK